MVNHQTKCAIFHSDVKTPEGKLVNTHQIKKKKKNDMSVVKHGESTVKPPNFFLRVHPLRKLSAVVRRASPTLGSCATEARSPRLVSIRMARGTCPFQRGAMAVGPWSEVFDMVPPVIIHSKDFPLQNHNKKTIHFWVPLFSDTSIYSLMLWKIWWVSKANHETTQEEWGLWARKIRHWTRFNRTK